MNQRPIIQFDFDFNNWVAGASTYCLPYVQNEHFDASEMLKDGHSSSQAMFLAWG